MDISDRHSYVAIEPTGHKLFFIENEEKDFFLKTRESIFGDLIIFLQKSSI